MTTESQRHDFCGIQERGVNLERKKDVPQLSGISLSSSLLRVLTQGIIAVSHY